MAGSIRGEGVRSTAAMLTLARSQTQHREEKRKKGRHREGGLSEVQVIDCRWELSGSQQQLAGDGGAGASARGRWRAGRRTRSTQLGSSVEEREAGRAKSKTRLWELWTDVGLVECNPRRCDLWSK